MSPTKTDHKFGNSSIEELTQYTPNASHSRIILMGRILPVEVCRRKIVRIQLRKTTLRIAVHRAKLRNTK